MTSVLENQDWSGTGTSLMVGAALVCFAFMFAQPFLNLRDEGFIAPDMAPIMGNPEREPAGQNLTFGGRSAEYSDMNTIYPASQLSHGGQADTHRSLDSQYRAMQNMESADSWAAVTQLQSLEPEVYKQHSEYTNDLGIANTGPSYMSVRTDPNDIVPWQGLLQPDYKNVWPGATSRVIASETPDQMDHRTKFMLN